MLCWLSRQERVQTLHPKNSRPESQGLADGRPTERKPSPLLHLDGRVPAWHRKSSRHVELAAVVQTSIPMETEIWDCHSHCVLSWDALGSGEEAVVSW
jgi:hypothetical protein